ncbi:Arm DNA-binding domain-containing protein [Sphingomonas sp.]|uniref:Arm DNA-binding domain-containing protein n=1 Tax=Sphingomonas sp. TaxID=28214 RepID=UPI003B009D2D
MFAYSRRGSAASTGAFRAEAGKALTDTAVRAVKPKDRDYKLADGGGLYLLVTSAGEKLWWLKCRMHGVERKLALGKYPDVTLSAARDAARKHRHSRDHPRRRHPRITPGAGSSRWPGW